MRRNSLYPRTIKPELIDAGDEIEVATPSDGGITVIKRGVVAYIQAHGGMRHLLTQEGAVIARYTPGGVNKLSFTLLGRIGAETPMLDMFTEMGRL